MPAEPRHEKAGNTDGQDGAHEQRYGNGNQLVGEQAGVQQDADAGGHEE